MNWLKANWWRFVIILAVVLANFAFLNYASAHRSGCHRWHSCPSDTGSYTCGDAGHPCQYPTYPKSGGVVYPPSGYYKDCYNCALKKVPDNAYTSGITFNCNSGYKKVGNSCKKVIAPDNSYFVGSSWYCNNGYRKVGGACQKVVAPANSYIVGSQWYCNNGYRKVNNSCTKVSAPANSYFVGATWYCNFGYKKVSNKCVVK